MRLVGLADLKEAEGKSIFDFVDDEMRRELQTGILLRLARDGIVTGEGTLRHLRTGKSFDIEYSLFMTGRGSGDGQAEMAIVIRDVSRRAGTSAEH